MAGLEQQLSWDVSAVLGSIQEVDSALSAVVDNFTAGLTAAVAELSSAALNIDASGLTDAVTEALAQAQAPIELTGDPTELDSTIADALDAPRPPIDIEADTSAVTSALDETVAEPRQVDVQADVSEAKATIDSLNTEPVTVDVDADTSQAQTELDGLTGSANAATGHGESGLHGLEGAALGLEAAAGAASGEVGGLKTVIGGISAETAGAVAAGAAFTAFLGETVSLAADAQAQGRRFNDVFGKSAEVVEHIDVGGLNTDLESLSKNTGTTVANLEASASRVGLLGQAAGAAQPAVAGTASDLLGLSAALAVANPRLGDTATVADTISRALSTGRTRSLIPYGISISQTAIQQEALNENIGKTKEQLTGYDKLVAGLTLVLEQQGDTLGTKYSEGIQNAQVKLRAFKVDLEETLVAVGTPLLAPVTSTLESFLPVAEQVGVVLGDLGQIIVPLVGTIGPLLIPVAGVLQLVGDGLQGIEVLLAPLDSGLGTVVVGIGLLTVAAYTVVPALEAMAVAGALSMGPVGWVALGIGLLATLGGVLDLFGHKTHDVAVDSTALDEAFQGTQASAAGYADVLSHLNKSIDDYLQKNLAIESGGKTGNDVLNELGLTVDGVAVALAGTDQQWQDFLGHVQNASVDANVSGKAYEKFFDTLLVGRQTLEDNAGATIAAAEAAGLLTKEQVANGQATFRNKGFNDSFGKAIIDNVSLLKQLAPQLAINTKLSQDNSFATFQQSSQLGDLQRAIRQGAVVLGDAKEIATQYNITQDQATEIIQNTESAMDRAAAATVNHSQAYKDLINQIAAGTIGEIDAQFALQGMGFSADGAAAAYKSLSSTISAAVTQIVGNLPSAGDAAKNWSEDIKTAFQQAASDAKSHTGSVKDDLAALAADSDPAKFAANLIAQAQSVVTFEANLKTLISEGLGGLAGFLAQQPFDVAGPLATKLAGDEQKAKLVNAALQLSQAVGGPQAQKFFDDNASALGLDVGTTLANGIIVGAQGVSGAAETASTTVAAHFKPDFSGRISTQVNAAAAALAADPTIGQAAGEAGLKALAAYQAKFGPLPLAAAVQVALGGAHDAIAADPSLAAAVGQKGKEAGDAFKPDIKGKAKTAVDDAADQLPQLQNLPNVAGALGVDTGEAFGQGMANGVDEKDEVIKEAGARAAAKLQAGANEGLGIKSPSRVGIEIGRNVGDAIVFGISSSGIVGGVSNVVGAAVGQASRAAVSSVAQGFNDPATISRAVANLKALIAKQPTASSGPTPEQQQFSQFSSAALSQLPGATSSIQTFTSNFATATTTQLAAFKDYRKAVADWRGDTKDVEDLTTKAGIAFGVLAAAQSKLARDTSAGAAKDILAADKSAVSAATSALDSLTNKLESARRQLGESTTKFRQDSEKLKTANTRLDRADDPASFTKELNAQTASERAFRAHIARLVQLGDVDLAQQLATAGVDAAGKLAAGFASHPAKAKAAEAAVDHAKAFSDSYTDFLAKEFAPKVQAAVTSAVTNRGAATITGATALVSPAATTGIASVPQPVILNTPAAVNAPAPPATPQVIELDLTVRLPDGTTVTAKQPVTVPKSPTNKTTIKTTVVGKVNA